MKNDMYNNNQTYILNMKRHKHHASDKKNKNKTCVFSKLSVLVFTGSLFSDAKRHSALATDCSVIYTTRNRRYGDMTSDIALYYVIVTKSSIAYTRQNLSKLLKFA